MIEQQSFDWHKWRMEGIGASDAPIILGLSPYSTPYQLWEEKLGLSTQKRNDFVLQKGLDLEKRARALYVLETGIDVEPMLVQFEDQPILRASLDGYNAERKVIFESKYVGEQVFEKGEVVEHHYPQLQHQLLCTDAERIDYVLYSEPQDKIKIIPVVPDPAYHMTLIEKEMDFWRAVQSKNPPDLSDKDFKKVKDIDLTANLERLKDIQAQIKELTAAEKEAKETILKHDVFKSHQRISLDETKVYKVFRKGNVDYSKIPALQHMDLEPYRKKGVEYWTFKF